VAKGADNPAFRTSPRGRAALFEVEMGEAELLRLAITTYEAGADPSLWPVFLEAYAHASSADVSGIQIHRFPQHRSYLIANFGLESRFRDSYNEHYSRLNIWREHGQASYMPGKMLLDREICPRELLKKSEFYNDYLRPMGGVYSMAGVITRDRECAVVLTALRDEHRNPWEPSDKRIAEFLLPHVRRACSIQQQLWIFQAGEVVLDSIPLGVVLFTADERAVYANRAAEAIFRDEDGLKLRSGVLAATASSTAASIRQAIRSAASLDTLPEGNEVLLVERKSLRRPYQVAVLPMRRQYPQFAGIGAPAVLVLITDPEWEIPVAPHLICKLYGLTPKEAELAGKLARGMSPEQAANELSMQYETARTHLKHIYSKMSISRQSELVALVGRIPQLPAD
jgi:DNA-binding CsgD family transcriptional regulator